MTRRRSGVPENRFRSRTIAGAQAGGSATDLAFGDFVLDAPWQVADVSRLLFRLGLSLVGFLITWYGAAHTTHVNRELGWLVGGSAAAAVGVIAVVAWETAGLARVRYLKLEVAATIKARYPEIATATASGRAGAAVWVSAPGMRLYHCPGCQLAAGKPVTPVSRAAIDRAGLAPCGACGA